MKATILSCTLKRSPEPSSSETLAGVVVDELEASGVECEVIRLADRDIRPGTEIDMGDGDEWPEVNRHVLESEILIFATPTWVGHPSSIAQRALERLDALMSETDEQERPVAFGKVAGVVVSGNEDGAHHVISEICGGLIDIGYTIPPQSWTFFNDGPGPGEVYLESDDREWSHSTGKAAAGNLLAAARALEENPYPTPPS